MLVYSKIYRNHTENVRKVLKSQQKRVIKLQPNKCDLFKKEVGYSGRMVSAEIYNIDQKDISAIQALKERTPFMVREVKKLVGFLSYYRGIINDF